MTIFKKEVFQDTTVVLDGNHYDACTFINVRFQFDGTNTFSFVGEQSFVGHIAFQFGQPAELVAFEIAQMLHHPVLGQFVTALLEKLSGQPRQTMN